MQWANACRRRSGEPDGGDWYAFITPPRGAKHGVRHSITASSVPESARLDLKRALNS
jgi:hypothetical protein